MRVGGTSRTNGSSPLARGLQLDGGVGEEPRGIIPARAGFTAGTRRSTPGPCGSSPLARGLRDRRGTPRLRGEDHPRSRGVYSTRSSPGPCPSGSSPLARGLHRPRFFHRRNPRIIPARAGFTRRPRARPSSRSGSSPLARGLPRRVGVHRHHEGIIPARAGFTPLWVQGVPASWDHPRSRGVYRARRRSGRAHSGSSPLARGLPAADDFWRANIRIIPARAGFTTRGSGSA